MKRRQFIKKSMGTMAALPIGAALMSAVEASAHDDKGWMEIPGTNGKIKVKSLMKEGLAEGILVWTAPFVKGRAHYHPQGEYSYIIGGSVDFDGEVLEAGDYSYMEPGTEHPAGVSGAQGVLAFVFTPEPVEFL